MLVFLKVTNLELIEDNKGFIQEQLNDLENSIVGTEQDLRSKTSLLGISDDTPYSS